MLQIEFGRLVDSVARLLGSIIQGIARSGASIWPLLFPQIVEMAIFSHKFDRREYHQ